ncbi:MAG: gamma-glutamylcyclotransferase [Alphaproteobacteria bacterium]
MVLDRETIRNGVFQDIVGEGERLGLLRCWTKTERDASRAAILDRKPPGPVWVFAYGSLIWNPAFDFAEKKRGRLYGYHRSFCLWTPVGRGTPENPGLVLALKRGGSCNGLLYRLHDDADRQIEELDIIWAREMVTGSYVPSWFRIETETGPVTAISFAINPACDRFAAELGMAEAARAIATAHGRLGPCYEYLENTVQALNDMNIVDSRLHGLRDEVARCRRATAQGAPS